MFKKFISFLMIFTIIGVFISCNSSSKKDNKEAKLPTLTYIGHASVKIKTKEGKVIYIDPAYDDGDYSERADYILVTHEHADHNKVNLCKQDDKTVIIRSKDSLSNGEYKTFNYDNIKIEAVPSGGNKNHSSDYCVGYIVTVDGISILHAGDTSMNDKTKEIKGKDIDYAMYPIDGLYNMDAKEATKVADLIGAKHNIPIHEYDEGKTKKSDKFTPKGKMILKYGETIHLSASSSSSKS